MNITIDIKPSLIETISSREPLDIDIDSIAKYAISTSFNLKFDIDIVMRGTGED